MRDCSSKLLVLFNLHQRINNLHNLQFLLKGGLERESGRINEKKWKGVRGKL